MHPAQRSAARRRSTSRSLATSRTGAHVGFECRGLSYIFAPSGTAQHDVFSSAAGDIGWNTPDVQQAGRCQALSAAVLCIAAYGAVVLPEAGSNFARPTSG